MKRGELERRLKAAGWRFVRHGGKHDIWADENGENETLVPRHSEITEYTAKAILKKAIGAKR